MNAQQSKGWCFTLNNPEIEDGSSLIRAHEDYVEYIVWQRERGANGTEHYQGYLHLKRRKRFAQVRRILGERCHIERRRGTVDQAIEYCTKEESRISGPWSVGERPGGQGTRTDIDTAYAAIKAGRTMASIADEFPVVHAKYHRGLEKYKQLCSPIRTWQPEVIVLVGPPGCGKTRTVYDNHSYDEVYVKDPTTKWWDGYSGQPVVLIDDFYGGFRFNYLLRLLDRYPMLVEVKGAVVQFLAKTIYLTSNRNPTEWYTNVNLDYNALARRFTRVQTWYENVLIE